MNRFRIVEADEAKKYGVDMEIYGEHTYRSYLMEFPPLEKPRLIGVDGGEPEDQTLGRDWSWVVGALNDAYAQGRKDAV